MAQVLTHMAEVTITTLLAAWAWLMGLNWSPATWSDTTWVVLFGLLFVSALLWLRSARRRQAQQRAPYTCPELLVTQGEIIPNAYSDLPAAKGQGLIRLTISNLSPYPLQVLELALQSDATNLPGWLELTPLLGVGTSVKLEEAIAPFRGQQGELSVYVYAPATPKKLFRLSAGYTWEPWQGRYKISPLGQRIEPARELASALAKRLHEQEWQKAERQRRQAEAQRRRQATRLERRRLREETRQHQVEENSPAPRNALDRPKIDFPDDF